MSNQEETKELPAIEGLLWFGGASCATAKAVYDKYGQESLDVMAQTMEKLGDSMFEDFQRMGLCKVERGDCLDLPNFLNMLAVPLMSPAEWPELTPERATARITKCVLAPVINKFFPDFCRLVFIGADRSYCKVVNPKIKVIPVKYLSAGDECCELKYELKK